ncbi:RNA polymerase sigma factor [Chitinophaga eiseniae]|uniref:RNA polymerase sigma factor n=1 Tax=Chitinophaga eiseniae TaxID=634771 RepID=A0A847SWB6_9BACT|nr:sigma-70 family RNA polymerase sigma factor [Chitinophaga eiseniae]NLR82469.1 sigma-70 family RNA polymerase sigma factor [Chitinophaga eiseniae]
MIQLFHNFDHQPNTTARRLSNPIQYSESALLSRIAEGDERAFATFYHHYYQLIFPFILKHLPTREDAEEVVQQTFLRAWLHRDKLADMAFVKAWLFKVATREYMNHVRNRLSGKLALVQLEERGEPADNNTVLDIKEINHLISRAMDTLSPQRRQVFYLSRREHLSIDEIAARMGISPKTVKNTLTAALVQVREYLAAAGYAISILLLLRF